jgi:hypothetical protein
VLWGLGVLLAIVADDGDNSIGLTDDKLAVLLTAQCLTRFVLLAS